MKLFGKKQKVNGLIAYYKLEDWWFSAFTEEERKLIDERYELYGAGEHSLTQGEISYTSLHLDSFLNSLATWFRSKQDSSIADRINAKLKEVSLSRPVVRPGYVEGRHYSTFVSEVDALKREGKVEEAITLLLKLVDATEAQDREGYYVPSDFEERGLDVPQHIVDQIVAESRGIGVAPAYYEQLAILYRKQKDYAQEVAILERFAKQKHAPGVTPPRLLERLEKAKELLAKSKLT